MRVLITGATGFIGSQVARLALRAGCEVFATIRETSDVSRIRDILPDLHRVPCDLLAADDLREHLAHIRPEMCIHHAWYAVPGKYLSAIANVGMLNASTQLVMSLAESGCARFVHVGSCFEYDLSQGYLSETSPTKPRSLYAASKLAFNILLEQIAPNTGMSIAFTRLFYQYGPFEDERRLMPSVICSLLQNKTARTTKGEQIRDFLHVEDVASALWAVAQSNLTGPVNIGSGKLVTVRAIITTIAEIIGKPGLVNLGALPYGPSDPMFVCANNHRLVENTTWAPRFELEDGLRQTIEWWEERLRGG